VQHTGKAPTGYTVTFRYKDPGATIVRIEGEWSFSSPELATIQGSEGRLASQWEPGDIAINPDAPQEILAGLKSTWPVANMTRDRVTGVWSYTTPLPSGVYSYSFVVNCTHSELTLSQRANPSVPATYTGCPEIADPSNPPWNEHKGVTHGSVVTYSQIYVPSDPAFHTVNYSWEAPAATRGALTDITYAGSGGPPNLPGKNYLAVYTPPGYDRHRSTPYPTLYLSHGYDNNEIDWTTGGDAASILDNLIDENKIEPMIVVMPNAYWEAPPDPVPGEADTFDDNLVHAVVPYIQLHYNVSPSPSQRAFAGLSFGGFVAGTLLVDDANEFGYVGVFSPAPFELSALSPAQVAVVKQVRVMVGGGTDDGAYPWAADDITALQDAGDRVSTDFVNGGHDWFVWRVLLHDFLTQVAFKPLTG
jgi:enterochelin esterase-like enzyme